MKDLRFAQDEQFEEWLRQEPANRCFCSQFHAWVHCRRWASSLRIRAHIGPNTLARPATNSAASRSSYLAGLEAGLSGKRSEGKVKARWGALKERRVQ
jgi:hypothetical protein